MEADGRDDTVSHVMNLVISRLTSADIQSTITPDEGRNVPWHYNSVAAVNTATQSLVGMDGLREMVKLDREALLGCVHGGDVVVVPGHVAALVGRDRALDVGAREPADHEVHDVRDRGVAAVGLHVARVLLGAHLVLAEEVAEGDGVGQVHAHAGRRGRVGRHGAQADVLFGHAHADRVGAVDGVLHKQLGHHVPGLHGHRVGVVGAVDLGHAYAGHHVLGHRRVDEAAVHVDVAVQDVVLRVLVGAVDALLGEHHGHLRPGDAAHVAVEVDRPPHLVLDEVERPARGAHP